jgi:thioredoxin 1
MNLLTLTSPHQTQFTHWLEDNRWLVACLCARWCDLCETYRETFDALAARHPDKLFVWIDIEDQAELVGEMEVENFPTLLIQRAGLVAFFGPLLPDLRVADRLLTTLANASIDELEADTLASTARRAWQTENNLRRPKI